SACIEVDGEAAYYFEHENVDDLLHALDTSVRAGRAPESVQRGKKRAAAFSWENAARQTLELYYEIA
ncbi:MAG: hypothetical protein ACK2UK_06635, partial [Candidatus Promineifilaceae bacterium]